MTTPERIRAGTRVHQTLPRPSSLLSSAGCMQVSTVVSGRVPEVLMERRKQGGERPDPWLTAGGGRLSDLEELFWTFVYVFEPRST